MVAREAAMRREWRVRRVLGPDGDGRRRWDRAYQVLLRREAAPPGPPQQPEVPHASSALYPGLDAAPGPGADHRAAAGAPAGLRAGAGLDGDAGADLPR